MKYYTRRGITSAIKALRNKSESQWDYIPKQVKSEIPRYSAEMAPQVNSSYHPYSYPPSSIIHSPHTPVYTHPPYGTPSTPPSPYQVPHSNYNISEPIQVSSKLENEVVLYITFNC